VIKRKASEGPEGRKNERAIAFFFDSMDKIGESDYTNRGNRFIYGVT